MQAQSVFKIRHLIILFVLFISSELYAQNTVSIGTDELKSSAILYLKGNGSQAFIIPIVDAVNQVSNPEAGMVVYQSSDNKVYFHSGSQWSALGDTGTGGGSTYSLQYNAGTNQLTLLEDGSGTPITLSSDALSLNGIDLPSGDPENDQILVYNGSIWEYQALPTGTFNGVTVDGTTIQGDGLSTPLSVVSVNDADADATNELQNLSLTGNTLNISNGTGVDLTPVLGTGGADQTLFLVGNDLTISGTGGNSVDLSSIDTDTKLTEAEVDAFVNNNGYLTSEVDGSITNEIQNLSLTGATLNISGGTGVDLAPLIPPGGTDDQNLVLTGDVLSIEGGTGSVDLSGYIDDADADATNEIQDLSLTGNTLSLTGDGTTVDLSGYIDNTDAQGLSLTGTTLNISGGAGVDLAPIIPPGGTDDQVASEVPVTAQNGVTSTNAQSALEELQAEIAANATAIAADTDGSPTNEIQNLSLTGTTLNISSGTGVDLAPIIPPGGTDDQNLVLTGDVLSIEGGTGSVDLSAYVDDADADATNEIQDLSLTSNTLSLSGDGTTVDLSAYLDNTDAQGLSLTGTTLNISGGTGVDLAPIIPPGGTDDQNLVLTGDVLSIEGGTGSVDLSTYVNDADADAANELQDLSLTGTTLNISGGTGVDLAPIIPAGSTDDQVASEVPVTAQNGVTSTDTQSALEELQGEISTNAGNITTNTTNIAANTTAIAAVTDDQTATEVSVTPGGNLTSTDVQNALVELQTDIDGIPALPATTDAQIIISNGTTPSAATMSGDIFINNTGVTTITANAIGTAEIANSTILNEDIGTTAGVEVSKLESGAAKGILTTNGTTNSWLSEANPNKVFGTDLSNVLTGRSVVLSTGAIIDNSGVRAAGLASDANLVSEAAVREAIDAAGSGSLQGAYNVGETINMDAGDIVINNIDGSAPYFSILQTDGKVGIGTASPGYEVDVRGPSTNFGGTLRLANSDVTHEMQIFPGHSADPNPYILVKAGDPLRFATDAAGFTETMRIEGGGNVGIGTTSPLSKFQIENTFGIFYDENQGQDIIAHNVYENGVGDFRYATTAGASIITMMPERVGFFTFPSGTADASLSGFSTRMNLTSDGLVINGDNLNTSSILDINSTTKGILVPRLTTVQRDAIASPATGLMVYNSTTNGFNFFNGSIWTSFGGGVSDLQGAYDGGNTINLTSSDFSIRNSGGGLDYFNISETNGNIGIGTTTNGDAITVDKVSDAVMNMISSNAALGTQVGLRLAMSTGAIGTVYRMFAEKNDATPGSTNADLIMRKEFSTGGGYLEFMKYDNASNGVIFNSDNTSATPYSNVHINAGNLELNEGIVFNDDDNSNTIRFETPTDITGNYTLTFPAALGSAGQVLATDASGNLGWVSVGSSGWGLTGNSGTTAGTNFLGTTDTQPLEVKVDNTRVMRFEYDAGTAEPSPNIIGGHPSNSIGVGLAGVTISGGGYTNANIGSGNWATIGGGRDNQAGAVSIGNYSTISGGASNLSTFQFSSVGGGRSNNASGRGATIPGGLFLSASSFGMTAVGTANETTAYTPNSWVDTEPIFVVGNGEVDASNNIISNSNAMTILKNGNVGIGTSSPGVILDINSTDAIQLPVGTTAEQPATPAAGMIRYNSTTSLFEGYDGGSWSDISAPTGGSSLISNAGTNNVFVGDQVAPSNTGINQTMVGYQAGLSITSGAENTFLGRGAGRNTTTAAFNVFVGKDAGRAHVSGDLNTFVGYQAGYSGTAGTGNTLVGANAGENVTTTGDVNTFVGSRAGQAITSGNSNVMIGSNAGRISTTVDRSVIIGNDAGFVNNLTGGRLTLIGQEAEVGSAALINATAIGFQAQVDQSNSLVLGSIAGVNGASSSVNIGIGTTTPSVSLDLVGTIKITDGTQAAGRVLTSDANGLASWQTASGGWGLTGNSGTNASTNFIGTTDAVDLSIRVNNVPSGKIEINNLTANTFLGYSAGSSGTGEFNTGIGWNALTLNTGHSNTSIGSYSMLNNAGGSNNTAIGRDAMRANTSGGTNTAVGVVSLYRNTSGVNNTALGGIALNENTIGSENTAVGTQAMQMNTIGNGNTATGFYALLQNTASNNVAVGNRALESNTTGTGNTALGYFAGYTTTFANANVTGSDNTYIGYNTGPGSTTQLTNATAIGANARATQSNSLILGNGVNVGIGTTTPSAKLDIQSTGNILINAEGNNGIGTWLNLYNNATGGRQYGLISSADGNGEGAGRFMFYDHTAGSSRMAINSAGDVGIGTTAPSQRLHVIGNILASGTITPSDIRYKKSIGPLDNVLQNISKLRGVSYYHKVADFPDLGLSEGMQIGVIAQEVEEIYPQLVVTDDKGYKAVEYSKLTPILLEAIKEQQKIIDSLMLSDFENKKKIEALESTVNSSKGSNEMEALQSQLDLMKSQIEKLTAILTAEASKGNE